jgi:hypothetical protein
MGICAQAQQRFWGMRETVQGDVVYYITHGSTVTHPFGNPPELLVGQNPVCTNGGGVCTCVFGVGSTDVGCGGGRYATIIYRVGGANTVTVFNRQNPGCYYYFDAYVGVASVTATQTPSATVSPFETPVLVADVFYDFTSTQGSNGWYYKYYSTPVFSNSSAAAEFTEFGPSPVMGGSVNYWYRGATYCMIREINLHPNTPADCSTPVEFCAPSVRWEAPAWLLAQATTNRYILNVAVAHSAYSPPSIDGVYAYIKANEQILSQLGPTPINIAQNFTVNDLTSAEFILNPGASCNSDRTQYGMRIYQYALFPSSSVTNTPTASVTQSPSLSSSVSASGSLSSSVSASVSPSSSGSPSQTRSLTVSASVSASQSSSVSASPSRSASTSVSPSQTRSRSVSRSVTRSRTMSPSVSPTSTPEFLVSRWPSATATSAGTASRSPAFLVTSWPTPGFTETPTASAAFMLLPYPSVAGSPDPAPEPESAASVTAKALGGAAVGVVGAGAVVMGIAQLMNVRPPQQQKQQRQDRDKEPSEPELRDRAPTHDDGLGVDIDLDAGVDRRRVRFKQPSMPGGGSDATALIAVRPEDVELVHRILAEHGASHEIIRHE